MTIATINPTTGETLKTFEPYDEAEVERRLALAESAFRSYSRTTFDERAALVRAMADVLENDRAALGFSSREENLYVGGNGGHFQ